MEDSAKHRGSSVGDRPVDPARKSALLSRTESGAHLLGANPKAMSLGYRNMRMLGGKSDQDSAVSIFR